MKKVLVVISSVRPSRISDKVLTEVQNEARKRSGIELSVADFREKPLPFFDGNSATAAPDFKATDTNVLAWTEKVVEADTLLILSAEYNHSYTAVLKNAIDWIIPSALEGKPVSFIGYGFGGGAKAIDKTRVLLTEFLKANPSSIEANLRIGQELAMDGTVIDTDAVSIAINKVLDEIEE